MFIQYTICVILILLCWIVKKEKTKKRYILPLSFLAIIIFFAIRYDYGLDYWSYFRYYESGRSVEEIGGSSRGTGEVWFYYFMNLFPKFSYFIIAHTIIVFFILFWTTRKYLAPRYYPLFFFLILTMSVLSFNWISALRSTLAAAILWLGLDLFYIGRKKWLSFAGMVIVASLFHTSALVFLVLPILDILILRINTFIIFILLVFGLLSTLFFTESIFSFLLSTSSLLRDTYQGHLDDVTGYSIYGVIHNSILLFPFYYIVTKRPLLNTPQSRIYVLATFIIIVRCFQLDFNGRFSAYIFIYVIFSLASVLPQLKKIEKVICMVPLLIWCFFGIYLFYMTMMINQNTVYSEGNYLYYHTIFEPTVIP